MNKDNEYHVSVPPGGGQKPEEALVNGSAFRAEPRISDRRAGELMRFAESRAENLDHLNRLGQCTAICMICWRC